MAGDEIWHGGDLAAAQALFPDAPKPWIDLSTGINPIPYPLPDLPQSLWRRLPGAQEEAELLAAARLAYRVQDHAGIVAAPGTQILIDLLPRLVEAREVAVLGPTYAEHARSWGRAGATMRMIAAPDETCAAEVVVLVNPNNPDGRVAPPAELKALAQGLATRGGLLVVDEAFADFTPKASILPELPPATLVLRSFGKAYGLAGLRLGFAIGDPVLTTALRDAMGPWAVAGPALRIGAAALSDAAWLARAAIDRAADAERLDALLAPKGHVVGATALFCLLEMPDAPALFAHLGGLGIYVRRFQDDPARLRFGLPGDAAEWERLTAALAAFAPGVAEPARSLHAPAAGDSATRAR